MTRKQFDYVVEQLKAVNCKYLTCKCISSELRLCMGTHQVSTATESERCMYGLTKSHRITLLQILDRCEMTININTVNELKFMNAL